MNNAQKYEEAMSALWDIHIAPLNKDYIPNHEEICCEAHRLTRAVMPASKSPMVVEQEEYQKLFQENYRLLLEKLNSRSNKNTFLNHYHCECGKEWEDLWFNTCNDRCPNCKKETEPYESKDIINPKGE